MSVRAIWIGIKALGRGIGHAVKWLLVLLWCASQIAILTFVAGATINYFYPNFRGNVSLLGSLRVLRLFGSSSPASI